MKKTSNSKCKTQTVSDFRFSLEKLFFYFGNVFSTALQNELKSFPPAESILYTKWIEKICIRRALDIQWALLGKFSSADSFGFFVCCAGEEKKRETFRLFLLSIVRLQFFRLFVSIGKLSTFIFFWLKVIAQWIDFISRYLIVN